METHSSFQRVAKDVLDLCELQIQLILVDSQLAQRKIVSAIICVIAGVTLAGSALTILLVSLGMLLGEMTTLTLGTGLLIVALTTCAVVAALLITAALAIKAAGSAMSETKSEFAENLRWLKATLVAPETSPRNQIREDSFPVEDQQEPVARSRDRSAESVFNNRTSPPLTTS